jgi:hypothetical protein
MGNIYPAVVFKDGANVPTARAFVRFLLAEGSLAHYLDFSGERMLPPMSTLMEDPLWPMFFGRPRSAAVLFLCVHAAARPTTMG